MSPIYYVKKYSGLNIYIGYGAKVAVMAQDDVAGMSAEHWTGYWCWNSLNFWKRRATH